MLAATGLVLFGGPSSSYAHPDVEAGRAHYERAELEQALAAFGRAETSGTLSRQDLIELLRTRVLVYYALGQKAPLLDDLYVLASIDPTTPLTEEAPPDVRRAFNRLRQRMPGPLELRVEAEESEGGDRKLVAVVENDIHEVVKSVRVHAQEPSGSWIAAEQSVTVRSDETTAPCYAEATGPGGATVATYGSEDRPQRCSLLPPPDLTVVGPEKPGTSDDEGVPAWAWIGGGVAAAGLAVLVVILASSGADGAQPSAPMVGSLRTE